MIPLESGLVMGLMRAVSPLKRVLSRSEKHARAPTRRVRGEEQVNAAMLKTGFAALATLIRRNGPVEELTCRVDQLAESVAKIGDSVARLSDAVVLESAQQARGRDELLTQLAFGVNDFKTAVAGPLSARVASMEEAVHRLHAHTDNALMAVTGPLSARVAGIGEAVQQLHSYTDNALGAIAAEGAQLQARLQALTDTAGEARNWAEARLDTLQNDTLPSLSTQLAGLPPLLAEIRNWIEKVHIEAPNLTHALLHQPLQELANTASETRNWAEEAYKWARQAHDGTEARLNSLRTGLAAQVHQTIGLQMSARARSEAASRRRAAAEDARSERYAAAKPKTFEAYLARAKRDYPEIFSLWWERFEAVGRAFDETKIGNAAQERDLYSHIFADFVHIHGKGRVLDIGCGVFGRPFYLQDYPANLISGIEPLPMKEPADFELVRGLGEYLPWPDRSFSTLVSATSLDHCLSLERSIAEMKRVLSEDGKLLLWVDLVPGSPRYEPNAPDYEPADQFHLFHFDKSWLEPMLLEAEFDIAERVELDMLSLYSKAFYLLRKTPGSKRNFAKIRRGGGV